MLQSRVNLGITETPVHFGAVEMVAIHGEYNTLHLAGLPLMLEMCDRIAIMYAGRMVEVAPVKRMLESPAHPYTHGLLKAFPSLVGPKEKLKGIEGSVPDLITPPEGCLFYERCFARQDDCKKNPPALEIVGENHTCACYHCLNKEVSGSGK